MAVVFSANGDVSSLRFERKSEQPASPAFAARQQAVDRASVSTRPDIRLPPLGPEHAGAIRSAQPSPRYSRSGTTGFAMGGSVTTHARAARVLARFPLG